MRNWIVIFVAVSTLGLLFGSGSVAIGASPNAANKVHVSSSTTVVFGPNVAVTLLRTSLKTSDKADVLIEFNSECAYRVRDTDTLFVEFLSTDTDTDAYAVGTRVWAEIDGIPVPVDPSAGDNGKVIFCRQTSSEFKSLSAFEEIEIVERLEEITQTANSFRWFAFDLGNGTHTVEIKADMQELGIGLEGSVDAAVGRRSLVVMPLNNLQ